MILKKYPHFHDSSKSVSDPFRNGLDLKRNCICYRTSVKVEKLSGIKTPIFTIGTSQNLIIRVLETE